MTTEQLAIAAKLASWKMLDDLVELAGILCRAEDLEAALLPGLTTAFEVGFVAGYAEAARLGIKVEVEQERCAALETALAAIQEIVKGWPPWYDIVAAINGVICKALSIDRGGRGPSHTTKEN